MKGSLKRLGPDRWLLVYDLPPGGDGRRRRKKTRFTGTKAEAERERRRAIMAVERGEYVNDEKLTVATLFARCFEAWEPRLAATTMVRYRDLFENQVAPAIGAIPLAKLRPLDVEAAYGRWRRSGRRVGGGALSERTVLHLHRLLRRALSQAVRWTLVTRNVADAVDAPRPTRREMTALDESQVQTLLDAARRRSRYSAIFAFLVWTGARRGEALALRWNDLDLDRAVIVIRRSLAQTPNGLIEKSTKSGKARTFAISAPLVEALRAHRVAQAKTRLVAGAIYQDRGLVFAENDGSPIPPHRLSDAFRNLLRGSGLPTISLHGLRHTNASLLGRAGVPLKVASDRLGHSTVTITADLYSHTFAVHDREAATALGALLGGREVGPTNETPVRHQSGTNRQSA